MNNINVQAPNSYKHAKQIWKNDLNKLKKAYSLKNINVGSHQVNSLLQIDWLKIKNNSSKNVIIVSSGTHGAEAYIGSLVQHILISYIIKTKPNMNFIFIHGLNPYGFKYFLRGNKDNIDLNRNFQTKNTRNNSFKLVDSYLNLKKPLSNIFWHKLYFKIKTTYLYLKHGKQTLLKSLSGQSQDSKSVNYSGKTPSAETMWFKEFITKQIAEYKASLHIDLHTGLGKKGALQILLDPKYLGTKNIILKMLPTENLISVNSDNFYEVPGSIDHWSYKNLSKTHHLSAVFEYGTMDSQTILGGLQSMYILRAHNQLYIYGAKNKKIYEMLNHEYENLFYPQDIKYLKTISSKTLTAFNFILSHSQ